MSMHNISPPRTKVLPLFHMFKLSTSRAQNRLPDEPLARAFDMCACFEMLELLPPGVHCCHGVTCRYKVGGFAALSNNGTSRDRHHCLAQAKLLGPACTLPQTYIKRSCARGERLHLSLRALEELVQLRWWSLLHRVERAQHVLCRVKMRSLSRP